MTDLNIQSMVISLVGPVGVGKSSVARAVADRMGLLYVDTGAMYRAVTLEVMRAEIDLDDTVAVAAVAKAVEVELITTPDGIRVLLDGEDASEEIRSTEVSRNTSPIADNVAVRQYFVALQRKMGVSGGVIMEGCDINTVVFPDADLKFYLDADPNVRAARRWKQDTEKGLHPDFGEVLADLLARDKRDKIRPVGALTLTDDDIYIDSSDRDEEEVISYICEIIKGYAISL